MNRSAADAHGALQQAAEWFAALQAGDASAADRASWQRWLVADPAHQAAWRKIEAVNARFGALPAQPALAALNLPSTRRAHAKKLLALAAVVAVGGVAARRESRDYLAALGADQRTAVGERRRLALADGSDVWMNTDSALDIDIGARRRRLALRRGEILLRTGEHPAHARQLVLDTGAGRLSAARTRFSVFHDGATSALSVFEGAVHVDAGGATRLAPAGTRLRFGPGWIGPAEPADEMQAAWTRGRLSVERMRLDSFLADLGRYWRGHLACHPALAELLLTGSYPLDDIDRILAALEKTLPLRVRRVLPWWITLEPVGHMAA